MKLNDMISKLQKLRDELGNVDVRITDGHNAACYSGDYSIEEWEDSGVKYVDIGIGGCLE